MNRALITQFVKANMNAVLAFVKENADALDITPTRSGSFTQSIVNTWCNSATDEQLLALAESVGYTADSAPATTHTPIEVAGLNTENMEVETESGAVETVPCYMLPVKKWDTEKSKNGVLTPTLKLDANGVTVKCYNDMFRNSDVRASIQKGDIIPVRIDSLSAVTATDKQGKTYTFYRGAVLEASQESMSNARTAKKEFELDFSQLDVETQKLVLAQHAQKKADEFMKKYAL